MAAELILAIDQGTTGSRVILFGRDGVEVGSEYREFAQHYPRPAWVEHDAMEIWDGVRGLLERVVSAAGAGGAGGVRAVGITNQRETTVLWDRRTGAPVGRAIVWQDRRTAGVCQELRERGLSGFFHERTGLPIDPYFSATKLAWMLQQSGEVRRRAEAGELAFGTVDSWLIWNLTGGANGGGGGEHVTDYTNASRTMLFNIHTLEWDREILELLRIPAAVLPRVVSSSGVIGRVAEVLGADGAPISGVAGDQQSALFGQACFEPGMVKNTYGTGSFALMHTGTTASGAGGKLVTTIAWRIGNEPVEYALEGSVFIAGAAVQWLRDGIGVIASARETEALARELEGNEGVYFVPALAGLGAPHWDPTARGLIIGLTRGTRKAHLARAALEAMAYQSRDVVDVMQAESGVSARELRADGGAAANSFLMQFQADILGMPVLVPRVLETTALGAAYLAGLGVGFWKSRAEIASTWKLDRRFEPRMDGSERERLHSRWKRAVELAKGWAETD